jgi:TOMM system kinase/cyclase fusion protein
MDWVESRTLGGYELVSRLGRGSYGEVHRALQTSTGQTVAVKILHIRTGPHAPSRATQVERFRREMAACAALQHPNIVRAIDAGTTDDGLLYSVFEYVPGPTLRAVLSEHRALPLRRLRDFMLQTLDALVCAHASGIIHRDFKPENIVVSTTGARPNFKILDFGISAFIGDVRSAEVTRLTGTDETVGTPAYAAPEQLRGETPTVKTDLYAWGLVALECLTGRPAVDGLSVAEVHYQQLSPHEVRLPTELAGHALGELLRWVLAKQPERRASDASAVYSKLEAVPFEELGSEEGYFSRGAMEAASAAPQLTEDIVVGPRGERRLLTAVSLRFTVPGPESGSEDSARASTLDGLLQDQRHRCQQEIQSAGGQLVAFTGNRALGIFGFPQAHEHDARRAARFALDVHQNVALQNHSLRARVNMELRVSGGLHTGLVTLRGDEVSADQVAGLVLAEAIDLANRAQVGEILATAASELSVRRDLDFQAAGEVVLATSGRAWPVFRLIGERDPFTAFTTSAEKFVLLGRADELHRLKQQFEQATAGTGRCVWLEGEPGVGKSYLLEHFRTALTREDCRWLQVRCLPETRQVALHPVLHLVRQQLGLANLEPEAAVVRLEQQLTHHGLDAALGLQLLCPWLQLPIKDPSPPRFAPQRMRELAIETLAQLVVELLGKESAVLGLEDAHWCDATTREWLTALRLKLKDRKVLLLATTRPGADPATRAACAPDESIQLQSLGEADAQALIARLAGDQSLEPSLVAEMVKRADGVPLFLEELTRYVISHRIVSGGSIEIPHSLRELLSARLDQLGPAKSTAQVAAVIGRDFDLALLERVAQRDNAALLGDIEQLVSAGLVQRERRIGSPRYRFHHALIQATAYDNLIPAAREAIHRRVALTIEAEFAEIVRTEPQVLALHWAAAKEDEKALAYAKRAAMDLLMRSSHLELIEQTRLALSWIKNVPDESKRIEHELDLTLPHLLALMSTRGWAEDSVSGVMARTEDLLVRSPTYKNGFNLHFALALFYHSRGIERDRALRASEDLVRLADAIPEHGAMRVFARTALANAHYMAGNVAIGEGLVEQVSREYDPKLHGPLAWQFGFDAYVGVVGIGGVMSWMSGDLSRSWQRLKRVKEYAVRLGHPESLASSLFIGCVLMRCRKDLSGLSSESAQLSIVASEHRLSVFSAFAELFQAELTQDVIAARNAVTRLSAAGHLLGLSYQLSVLADVELSDREVVAAHQHLDQAVEYANSSGERFWLPRLLRQRAATSQLLGLTVAAIQADLDAAIEEASSRGMLTFELEAHVECSRLLSKDGPKFEWLKSFEDDWLTHDQSSVREALTSSRLWNSARGH